MIKLIQSERALAESGGGPLVAGMLDVPLVVKGIGRAEVAASDSCSQVLGSVNSRLLYS